MSWLDGFTARAFFDFASAITLLIGLAFLFIGAVGVLRLPDAYNRIHAASICVTLGLSGMIVAACLHIGTVPIIAKAGATILFILAATPVGSHLLAKAAHHGGLKMWDRTLSDDLTDDKHDPARTVTDEFGDVGQSSSPAPPAGPGDSTDESGHEAA